MYSNVNQLCVYRYPLFLGFASHLGHRRALNRVPCGTRWLSNHVVFICICTIFLMRLLEGSLHPPSSFMPHQNAVTISEQITSYWHSS